MPVYIRKDEELTVASPAADTGRQSDDLRAAQLAGARASLLCLVLAAGGLILLLRWLAAPLVAADKLLASQGFSEHLEMFMPLAIFAFFGAGAGALVAWRISSTISFATRIGWIMAVAVILLLAGIGCLAAPHIFSRGVPVMAWFSLATVPVAAFAGLYLFIAWTH